MYELKILYFFVNYITHTVQGGVWIGWSVPFFRQICWSAKMFVQIRNHNHIRKQKCKGSKVNCCMWMPLLMSPEVVKKATFLMTITQYNSNNSLTSEFKWTSFEKRNNLDELINIKTEAEGRSMIQISFRTQDPNIRQAQSGIRVNPWSMIHCVFKIHQSARFTAKIHNLCSF